MGTCIANKEIITSYSHGEEHFFRIHLDMPVTAELADTLTGLLREKDLQGVKDQLEAALDDLERTEPDIGPSDTADARTLIGGLSPTFDRRHARWRPLRPSDLPDASGPRDASV